MLWSLVCFGYYNKNTIHWRHLNHRNLFLHVLEAGKFKSKALAYLVSAESSLSGSQITVSVSVLTWQKRDEGVLEYLL